MDHHYYQYSPLVDKDEYRYENDRDYATEELEGEDGDLSDQTFDILRDIDTVLFFRVNSFFHSVTNRQLESRHIKLPQMNETAQMPNDEKT